MLSYSRHARRRMEERRISEDEVRFCLDNYVISYTDKKGNPNYIAYTQSNRRIKVVVEKDSINPTKIITVAD